MEIINVLNREEFLLFRAGQMIQLVGTNPIVAYNAGRGTVARAAKARTNGTVYTCKLCKKDFTTRQAYGGHMSVHTRKALTHQK